MHFGIVLKTYIRCSFPGRSSPRRGPLQPNLDEIFYWPESSPGNVNIDTITPAQRLGFEFVENFSKLLIHTNVLVQQGDLVFQQIALKMLDSTLSILLSLAECFDALVLGGSDGSDRRLIECLILPLRP